MKLKIKINLKSISEYILLVIVTAFCISSVLVAIPLTEKVYDRASFDLRTKDKEYWSKEYLLELESRDNKDIQKSRDILFKRLKKLGVEKASIRELDGNRIVVVVNTTIREDLVREVIISRFDINIVTRKEDVDFFSEEDPYAYLFGENYNVTEWSRNDFRNVYITELKTNDNTYSNFAIFKPWSTKLNSFTSFLKGHIGEYIGVDIDGFVTPYLVPFDDQSIFAIPVTTSDPLEIKALNILYNSGTIPTQISLVSENELDTQILNINHINILIALSISLLFTYIYLLITKQMDIETLKKSFFATVLTMSIYISFLKLLNIPIDTFLIPITSILTFVLIKVLSENDDSVIYLETAMILILIPISLLGLGYVSILGWHMISLVILSKLSVVFSGWYINKVRSF